MNSFTYKFFTRIKTIEAGSTIAINYYLQFSDLLKSHCDDMFIDYIPMIYRKPK